MAIHCPKCDEPHAVGEVCARCATADPRLWIATVEFEFVVMAGSKKTALSVADEHVQEELRARLGIRDEVKCVRPVASVEALPVYWDGDCVPWGSEDDKTCAEVLAETADE